MKKIITLFVLLVIAGCSQGTSSVTPQEKPMGQIIAELEASGKYPVLDRTDALAGIDSDKNGIRDDIDLYISKKGFNPKQLKAVNQISRVIQRSVVADLKNKGEVKKLRHDNDVASACLFDLDVSGHDYSNGLSIAVEIASLTANTKKRLKNYLLFNDMGDGSTWSPDDYKDPCNG